jgi:tetratricopeptide (TPR) repeat protein
VKAQDGSDPGEVRSEVRPGELSALLQKLAQVSEAELGAGWDRALHPGAVVGRFELLREIGRGGFGVVWEARDRTLGRLVAFKAVRAGRQEAAREERLLAEAEAVARLSHPNIVSLFDVGQSEHGPYLVLELLRGETLEARLAGGPLPAAEALGVAAEIARGLAHAHGQGVAHRDLKPGNVFLCQDGPVKLLDFGLSHALGRRKADGGTPAYMAPEQRQGAPEDERTDVFALGAILFRMLSGRLPFRADDGGKELCSARPAPALEVPGAPGLGELVARMLEKEPTRRPRDGGEVLEALHALATGPEAAPAAPVRVRRRVRWRLPALVALGAALGLLAVWRWRGPPPPPPLDASGRVVVAVADVENRTGEATLDALTGLLVTSLEQSKRLLVLTRSRMLDLARQEGRSGVERVDEVLGRDLGRKAGARALLVPVVHRLGGTYALELRAVDPVKDQHLFAAREQVADQAGLLGAIDRLSDRVRRELQESPEQVAASRIQVGEAVTRSLEAYQHYVRGQEARLVRCDLAADEREQRQALAHDPELGVAHMELGTALGYIRGDYDGEVAETFRKAWSLAERAPEKERLMLQLDPYLTPAPAGKDPGSSRDEVLRLVGELESRFPTEKFVLFLGAHAAELLGDNDRAIELFRRALALDPGQCFLVSRFVNRLIGSGRFDEAVELARNALTAAPNAWNESTLGAALVGRGNLEEAVSHARRALATDDGANVYMVRNAICPLLLAGHVDEAEAALRRLAERGFSTLLGRVQILTRVLAMQGRVHEMRRAVAPFRDRAELWFVALDLGAGRTRTDAPEVLAAARKADRPTAAFLAFLGDLERAEAQAKAAPPGSVDARVVRAARLLHEGDPARAVEELWPVANAHSAAVLLLAESLLAAGRPAEALEAISAYPQVRLCISPMAAYRGSFMLLRAEALEKLGRRAEALAEVDALLALWKNADPDLPLLAEAKARRARLAVAGKVPR